MRLDLKKRCRTLVFMALILCSVLSEATKLQESDETSYFPLQVGNWWEYEGFLNRQPTGRSLKSEIVGSKVINQQNYFILLNHYPRLQDTLFVRVVDQKVFVNVVDRGGTEDLWLDFAHLDPWEGIFHFFRESVPMTVLISIRLDGGLQGITDNFGKKIRFEFDNIDLSEDHWFDIYAYQIGPVYKGGGTDTDFWYYRLKKARIGSKVMDFTTFVRPTTFGEIKNSFR